MAKRWGQVAAWCVDHQNNVKNWLEISKSVVEIAALCIGGWWAYTLFIRKDAPALEQRAKTEATLEWVTTDDTRSCRADFQIQLENIGTTAFDVASVRVRAWQFDDDKLDTDQALRFVDVNKRFDSDALYDETFVDHPGSYLWVPFVQHYPPGTTWRQSLEFLVAKKPGTRTLFLVQFFKPSQAVDDEPLEAAYAWEPTCGDVTRPVARPVSPSNNVTPRLRESRRK